MNWLFGSAKRSMITPGDALPGRPSPGYDTPDMHSVLGTSLSGPWPDNPEVIYLGMGCFWGAEKKFWRLPGVVSTSVGYMGGFTPNPTYEEVCTGRTGHTETVMVAYDPSLLTTYDVLKVFWENHDPTQGFAQGNDIGTQYRSALYWTTEQQHEVADATRDAYNGVLAARGFDPITTEIAPAADRPYYLAEDYHQQYLFKNPHGYDCHAHTGIDLPPLVA
ncbi:MAG: peptide-methionine (S)-S-oxide reductase MsrA [Actinomycetes bacterium]